jgi:TetR/AcrR family transcriptional regulator, cholesterol catabolism regulator
MKDRRSAILDVASDLAEEGGFDNVRQRDVAARAGVALGTLYKSFRSKEDILCAALERETEALERRMESRPPKGETARERLRAFFDTITRGMCKKPNYARAVLRAMASGVPEIAGSVAAYQERMNRLIVAAALGKSIPVPAADAPPAEESTAGTLGFLFQHIWSAALVGWSAGLVSQAEVVERVGKAVGLLLPALDLDR